MKPSPLRWILVTAFAVALGHLVWSAVVGPPTSPEYTIGGDGPALTGHDPHARHLYLRRELHLTQRPRRAWIEVVALDRVQLYVNGRYVATRSLDGLPVGVVADLTPYLRVGTNVIGITSKRASEGGQPVVRVAGAYTQGEDEQRLEANGQWHCATTFERGADWWLSAKFDDRHWPAAQIVQASLRAVVDRPPRTVTAAGSGRWITPADWKQAGPVAFRREFDVRGTPQQAWLRVTTSSDYKLAINGIVIDTKETTLGTGQLSRPTEQSYDITPMIRSGRNHVAVLLSGNNAGGLLRLLVDLGVENRSGEQTRVGTDEYWLTHTGPEWLVSADDDWEPCQVVAGDLGVASWETRPRNAELSLPARVVIERVAGQFAVMVAIGVLTFFACRLASRTLFAAWESVPVAYLALVLPTLGIAAAVLATYDPSLLRQDVYRGMWVVLALASVSVQWLLLAATAHIRGTSSQSELRARWRDRFRRWAPWIAALAITALAFLLRFRDLESEPLHWDEVDHFRLTQGALLRGFPSQNVPFMLDLPPKYTDTSELLYLSTTLAAFVFDDDRYIVRFPAICWGTLTVLLAFIAGRQMFGTAAGLLAATVCAVGPTCVGMSCFGRYFAQLQFFTLSTVYALWLTVRHPGHLNRRALALTTLSFIATYLTWEGAGLLAPGFALAALIHCRKRLGALFGNRALWLAVAVVALVAVAQQSHRNLQQTRFMRYAISLSSLKPTPMWKNQMFRPWYYFDRSSWSRDSLLPMLGLAGAVVLTVHPGFRRPTRFLLVSYVGGCLSLSFLLPVSAPRYVYHLTPLLALLGSAVVVAGARGIARPFRHPIAPPAWRAYACVIGAALALTVLALASGRAVRLDEMRDYIVEGYRTGVREFPDLEGPSAFLRGQLQENDVLLLSHPVLSHHLMGRDRPDWSRDFSPLTTFRRTVTLEDSGVVPVNPYDATVTLSSLEGIRNLFDRNQRVWYVVIPSSHERQNTSEVSAFLRQHMDVVYEDFESIVLFRGNAHRPATERARDDRELKRAGANFLP